MKTMNIPPSMMEMLRGRRGLDSDDESRDDEIRKLSPEDVVRQCAAWELGDRYWADKFAGWMKAVGAKPENF